MTCGITDGERNFTQLNNGLPTAEYDCGVETTKGLIYFASCGQVTVGETRIRKLMGAEGKVATNPIDWKTAIESPEVAALFAKVGLKPPKARYLSGVDISLAETELKAGKMLGAAIWYGTLNVVRPILSGSRSFGDNHAVRLYRFEEAGGHNETDYLDPLRDGRFYRIAGQPIRYPKGRTRIPWWLVAKLCADVRIRTRDANGNIIEQHRLGDGKFFGISVARAKALVVTPPPDPQPEPEPEPPVDPCQEIKDQLATVTQQRDDALAEVDRVNQQAIDILIGIRDQAEAGIDSFNPAGGEDA
jgi:hypothetical protein